MTENRYNQPSFAKPPTRREATANFGMDPVFASQSI